MLTVAQTQMAFEMWVTHHPFLAMAFTWHCKDPWRIWGLAYDGIVNWRSHLATLRSLRERITTMFNPIALMAGAMQVMGHVSIWIPVVETEMGPGTGAEKKAKVVAQIQQVAPQELNSLGVPAWAQNIMLKAEVLGMVIDALCKMQQAAHDLLNSAQSQAPADAPAA